MQVVDKGRVPIIKAEAYDTSSGLVAAIDISMHGAAHTGLASTAFVSELVKQLAPLKPLALVLKEVRVGCGLCRLNCSQNPGP